MTTEKRLASSFRSLAYTIKNEILQESDRGFSLLTGIDELHIKSLLLRGDAYEKVPTLTAYKLLQVSGVGDDFSSKLKDALNPKHLLPESPLSDLSTEGTGVSFGANINLMKCYEVLTLHALHNRNLSPHRMHQQGLASQDQSTELLAPDSFYKAAGNIGSWARWVTVISASEEALLAFQNSTAGLSNLKDRDKNIQLILDRTRNHNAEAAEAKELALEKAMELHLSKSHTLSFSPGF